MTHLINISWGYVENFNMGKKKMCEKVSSGDVQRCQL